MSVRVKAKVGSAVVEVEGQGVKDIIEQLTPFYEVFGEKECGKCQCQELAVEHRKHDEYNYYSLRCLGCRAQLDLGQKRVGGTLFPKRQDKEKNWLDNHGWYSWKDRNQDAGGDQETHTHTQPEVYPDQSNF